MTILNLILTFIVFALVIFLIYRTRNQIISLNNVKENLNKCEHKQVMAKKDIENWDLHQRSICNRIKPLEEQTAKLEQSVSKLEQITNANAREWNKRYINMAQKISLMESSKNAGSQLV